MAAKARRFAAHRPMLPARTRPAGSGVRRPSRRLVQLLEPVDERLDPGVVAQELGRRRDLAAEQLARTGSKNSIAGAPRGRYGRLASRKCTAGAVSPRSRISRATASTRASRRSSTGSHREAHRALSAVARRPTSGRDRRGLARRQRVRECVVGGGTPHREDDVLDRRRRGRARPDGVTVTSAASSSGSRRCPVPSAGKATVARPSSRTRASRCGRRGRWRRRSSGGRARSTRRG